MTVAYNNTHTQPPATSLSAPHRRRAAATQIAVHRQDATSATDGVNSVPGRRKRVSPGFSVRPAGDCNRTGPATCDAQAQFPHVTAGSEKDTRA